jgi:toxin HigB-1
VEERSQIALPRLLADGFAADAAFVDGSHIFHNVFVDLFYLRELVRPGGLVILDDCGYLSVATAARYFEVNTGWAHTSCLHSSSPLVTHCVNNVTRYHRCVLRSFRDEETKAIWHRQRSRRLDGPVQRVAWRKLAMLDAAETLTDLLVPPGNRLEKLTGDRAGQYSIRINQQWRICFVWSDAGPEDVEIVDYH